MKKVKANFTIEDIKKIEAAESRDHAQELLRKIVEAAATGEYPIKPEKVQALYRQILGARDKNEVIAIGYNMLLAGEGLSTVGSRYQNRYA